MADLALSIGKKLVLMNYIILQQRFLNLEDSRDTRLNMFRNALIPQPYLKLSYP